MAWTVSMRTGIGGDEVEERVVVVVPEGEAIETAVTEPRVHVLAGYGE
jgi:hypothetical protein